MKTLAVLLHLLIAPALFAQWVELTDMSPQGVIREFLADGETLYVATDADGVFKTTDIGDTWLPASSGLTDLIVQSIAGTSTDLYASTQSGRIYHSVNAGENWDVVFADTAEEPIFKLLLHGSTIFAASLNGIYASSDSGKTWIKKDTLAVSTLATNGSTLFAAGINAGLHRSTDNGETWVKVIPEIPEVGSFGRKGSTLYLTSYSLGVLVSTDDGLSWTPRNDGFLENAHPGIFAATATTLFVGSEGQGLYRLIGESTTWEQIPGMPPNSYIMSLATYHGQLYVETNFLILRRPLSQLQDVAGTKQTSDVSLSANPARNMTTISFAIDEPSQVQLSLIDALGRTLQTHQWQMQPGKYEHQLQLQTLPDGAYFLRLQHAAITELIPLIVRK